MRCAGGLSLAGDGEADPRHPGDPLVPLVGNLAEAQAVLAAHGAREVIVALDPQDHHHLPQIANVLSTAGVPFRVVPSLFEYGFKAATLRGFQEMPVIELNVDPTDRVEQILKRALDVVTATLALTLSAPALLAMAAAVKLTSPGPVFFRQDRVGGMGRHFQRVSVRTLVEDAEVRLAELRTHNEAEGPLFKIKADPRLTPVGAFLRTWSLGEFPQFWNVLRGDMSMVGPRPPLPWEVEDYETQHHCRLKDTPGITGLWQVSGRSDLSFDQMVKLDRYYIQNWWVGLDLGILLKTAYVVLARKGAY
jgi:exopolysaccharide biosynthesis polyprenyl glycosylphosphotransferase